MVENKKRISGIKIVGVFCLVYFTIQIFAVINLFIYHHYNCNFTLFQFFFNLLIYVGALLTIINLLPQDFIFRKDDKNE